MLKIILLAGLYMSAIVLADSSATQSSPLLSAILAELRQIQPPMFDQANAAEEAMVAKGKDILPALRQARLLGSKLVGDDELTTNRYSTGDNSTTIDMSPREQRVRQLADLRLGVLGRVIARLDFGFDPPTALAKWATGQGKPLPGQPQLCGDAGVDTVFPDLALCSVAKSYSPVPRMDEESSWPAHCVFAVDHGSNVTPIIDAKALEAFFRKNLAPVQGEREAAMAIKAWLTLTQFLQDHAPFPIIADSVKAAKTDGGWMAQGRASAGAGDAAGPAPKWRDNGFVEVTLIFTADGRLDKVGETIKVRPGLRPICQSSKLLDPDPIVRQMARTELRLMGRSAEEYLKARRQVASPELRKAIDGIWQQILDDEHDFGPCQDR